MKRGLTYFFCLLLVLSMSVSVMAATEASRVDSHNILKPDGSCAVSLQLTLHLEETVTELTFPIPAQATDVLLDGNYVTTHAAGDRLLLQLPNLTAGDYRFTIAYRLPNVVSRESGTAQVSLALLSGFAYPIADLEFSVTLPGEITGSPLFTSGYHQEDIRGQMAFTVSGDTLTARMLSPLMDHETLLLQLPVDPQQFPQVSHLEPLLDLWDGLVLSFAVLAIVYYLLTLNPQFHRREPSFCPPDGISAGEVGVCLTGTGLNLTLMVLTWAQLGYLQLEMSDRRHVILRKKMSMGNERSPWEVRLFQELFGSRSFIDGCGLHYARIYRRAAMQAPLMPQLFRPNSGRPLIFRLLSCAAGIFSGVKLGLTLTDHPAGQVLLTILVCLVCGVCSYVIQAGGKCLPLRGKLPLVVAIVCGILWITLGSVTDGLAIALPMVLFQFACGIAIAFGGRRSELGQRSLAQIQGLRHYMLRANPFELQQRLQANGNYFFELQPYALAMGVDKVFARRFGKLELEDPGFLLLKGMQPVTATQWADALRQVNDALNFRQRTLTYDQLTQE